MFISRIHTKEQSGFTIVELMIATTVFSVILLLCTYGLIQIGRNYYKGSIVSRTQNVTRAVLDDVTQSITYGASAPSPEAISFTPGDTSEVCIGNKKYVVKDQEFSVSRATGDCSSVTGHTTQEQNLIAENMHVREFSIVQQTDSAYTVKIKVSFGETDLYDEATGFCKGGRDSQFCATSGLTETVKRRLK
jgi:prepilin-type N-terminal cleavage/methylation domain-containing protein